MGHVFMRLPRQLIHGQLTWRRLHRPLQTPFAHPAFCPTVSICHPARLVSATGLLETDQDAKAKKLNQKDLKDQEQELKARQGQVKRPWHRQDVDKPPVDKSGKEVAPITKGLYRNHACALDLHEFLLTSPPRQAPHYSDETVEADPPLAHCRREGQGQQQQT